MQSNHNNWVVVLASSSALLLGGCAGVTELTQFASARQVPCNADAITISNVTNHGPLFAWDATCKGKTYQCTGKTTGNDDINDALCKKMSE